MQIDAEGNAVLSVREAQVLQLLCTDAPADKEIAARIGIAERTVCDHMRSIRAGLGLYTRGALIIWGIQHPEAFQGEPVPPTMHKRCCSCGGPVCSTGLEDAA